MNVCKLNKLINNNKCESGDETKRVSLIGCCGCNRKIEKNED